MFLLLTIEDKILLNPSELNNNYYLQEDDKKNIKEISKEPLKSYNEIIYLKLREKYISKILLDYGLVISIRKFKIKSNLIVEIEGLINIEYEISLIIFKPQIGDILYGNIENSDETKIIVDCGIIKVKVPIEQILKPCFFNKKENVWIWNYNNENNFYYDKGKKCRMKVIDVKFKSKREISKIIEKNKLIEKNKNIIEENNLRDEEINNNNDSENKMDIDKEDEIIEITKDVIMEIFCTFKEEGLGPLEWWN
jgi:DNA-directed RNA polymerase subunit E'/Rpb7